MTRTARGHTGRPLVASRPEVAAYGLVLAAVGVLVGSAVEEDEGDEVAETADGIVRRARGLLPLPPSTRRIAVIGGHADAGVLPDKRAGLGHGTILNDHDGRSHVSRLALTRLNPHRRPLRRRRGRG